MNNLDRISPYRQPTITTYQNVDQIEDVEFLEKLPKDVLEMINKGDLDGAMAKLRDNDQENETFVRLFLQLIGEMTTNLWKPLSDGANKLFSLFRRPEVETVHNKDKVERPGRTEDRRDLKTASTEQKALYMQEEIEKINNRAEIHKKSLLDNPMMKQLSAMAEKADMLRLQIQSLLSMMMLKSLSLIKSLTIDKGLLPVLDKAKLMGESIKNFGSMIDQKVVMPFLKTASIPFVSALNFMNSSAEQIERLYESIKQKVVEPFKEKLRVFDPLLEKFVATRNKAVEIGRTAAEWLSDRADAIKNTVKSFTPSLNLKPAFQYVDDRFRNLVDHSANLKEVVVQNLQGAVQAFQHLSHAALATMLPMINLFAAANQTTLRYSLNGVKYLSKKLQEGFSKFAHKMELQMIALQKKIVKAATATINVSLWFLKTLYKMLVDLYNAFKRVALRFFVLAWQVIKMGAFIFWNILSTLPSATAFLIRKGMQKLKKSVLAALRKRKEEAAHQKSLP